MSDTEAEEVRLKLPQWRAELGSDVKRTVSRQIAFQLLDFAEYKQQELQCIVTAHYPIGGVED